MSGAVGVLVALLIAATTAGLVALTIWWSKTERERRQRRWAQLCALVDSTGWSLTPSEPGLIDLSAQAPFGIGHSRAATDVVRGELDGIPFASFTYTYVVTQSNGKTTTSATYQNMVTCIRTPPSPHTLTVAPEGPYAGLLDVFGMGDLKLESDDFNRRFNIRTNSDRFAYDVLNPTNMHWMLTDRRFVLPFRFENANLMTWRQGELTPEWVQAHARYLIDILRQVPGYAWDRR